MRVLQIHNYYQFPGGEDSVAAAERKLLADYGNEVYLFERHNQEIDKYGSLRKLFLFFNPTWSFSAQREVARIVRSRKIDIVHLHNFFPLVSPSVLYACATAGVPVVYTLHNWRLLCANGILYRDGEACTKCIDKGVLQAIRHACYRRSTLQTVSVVLMQIVHRNLKTWQKLITLYVAPSEFVKEWFVKAGFPTGKIIVKPHFDYAEPKVLNGSGKYALFVGRLIKNKGIFELLEAWKSVAFPLKVVGSGPDEAEVRHFVDKWNLGSVELCGQATSASVVDYIKESLFLIVPSLHHEAFAKVVIEAFACGIPVVGSRRPPLTELIDDGRNGLLFEAGAVGDICNKVKWLIGHELELNEMGIQAKNDFDVRFSAEENYRQLIDIYGKAIKEVERNRMTSPVRGL
jgi:glycosyltransferase involved in cell wall biosynthesis